MDTEPTKVTASLPALNSPADLFWRNYFAVHPEPGSIPEMNTLRKWYQRWRKPKA